MEKQIVEINGIKFEVDLTKARQITEYRVGQPVKVLVKKYSDVWEAHPGVIVGFDPFDNLPSVNIAYLEISYSSVDMKFTCFNAQSKDIEICPVTSTADVALRKSQVIELLEKQIQAKKIAVEEAELKLSHFLQRFGEYFKIADEKEEAARVM